MFQEQDATSVHHSYHDYEQYLESAMSTGFQERKVSLGFHIVELILPALPTMV
jgi:hypothetical protein